MKVFTFGFGAHRHGRHEARIDAAAEHHTDRHVRHQLTAHRILEQRLQSLHERGFIGRIAPGQPVPAAASSATP